MANKSPIWAIIAVMCLAAGGWAQDDVVLKAMRDEMARTVSQLRLHDMDKPYFVAYRVKELESASVSASLGSLTQSRPNRMRFLSVELRVGDYSLDNGNFLSTTSFSGGMSRMFRSIEQVPLDDNYLEIRRQLWLATDAEYKKALEDLAGKRAALQTRKETEHIADFSKEEPETLFVARKAAPMDLAGLEKLAREVSAIFKAMPDIYQSGVAIEFQNSYVRYVNSEGTSFTQAEPMLKIDVRAETQAANGQPIRDSIHLWAHSPSELPKTEQIAGRARELGARLARLRAAEPIETYNGPVLFEGEAAAEIFAQAFAPGLLATRMPMSDEPRFEMYFDQLARRMGGASFLDKLGGRIMPDFLDVTDNPKLTEYAGTALMGSYRLDDDGVPGRETKLVEKGILKTLLTTRTPVRTIARSSGNRRGMGPAPSNLIVTARNSSPEDQLRKELLRRVTQRGMGYGIVVRHMGGAEVEDVLRTAALVTRQAAPSATLVEVYKLFPDGREEPVRGMELMDLTAAMFKDIVAAGDRPVVYTNLFMLKFGGLFSYGMAAGMEVPEVSFVVPP
ncbi:MAG TPA: metallopeptidase TldD-related protein, partial [Terriglobales bacterium]|nr:metallopeptidase TldD-related protein [Terriglobales bacterium]